MSVTYYDALWRPVLTRSYASDDEATTRKVVLRRFDADGRVVFESYPERNIASVNATPAGTSTLFDALGRIRRSEASSELGPLATSTEYLPGLQVRTFDLGNRLRASPNGGGSYKYDGHGRRTWTRGLGGSAAAVL